ncbi:MAG TPA: PEGA domain-containing protein, partial [Polyangiaceae bacterium]|nr:PEGA domain-containing protein [Polyangiaceae bacterium]
MKRLLPTLLTSVCVIASSTAGLAKPRVAAAAAAAEPARPAPDAAAKKEAKTRFEHAIKLYEDGDYSVALAEFERVYELVPDYRVLYNIGQVSIQLGHYARALNTLKEYMTRGATELSAERAKSVQADIDLLAVRTASIALEVDPEGVEVTIDGRVLGTTPISDPIVVDVGERRVELKRAGYVSQEQTLSLAGGDRYVGKFKLIPESIADKPKNEPPVALFPPATKPLPPKSKAPIFIGYGATVALAAGSAVAFGLGASSASDLKNLRTTPGATRTELDNARDRAKTRLLVSTVLGAAAAVTGAVTLYFHISSSGKERPRAKNDVWVGVAPTQVSLGMSPAWLQ